MGQRHRGAEFPPSHRVSLVARFSPIVTLIAASAAWTGLPAANGAGPDLRALSPSWQEPLHRWRDTNGLPQWGPQNEVMSHNWAGYALDGGPYTAVQGGWTVPKVTYQSYSGSPGVEVTSTWVGIGGQENDSTLIQIGTQEMAAPSGESAYFAWYEMLPANETPINPKQFPVAAGDIIDAVIQCTASCAPQTKSTWLLTLTNGRWPKPFTVTLQYTSSLASAEWIVEGPCVKNCNSANPGFAYLPNYGTTTFTAITVNNAIPLLARSPNGIIMKAPNGNATSTPSNPVGGNSFTVSFAT
jgi:hypothetical protein